MILLLSYEFCSIGLGMWDVFFSFQRRIRTNDVDAVKLLSDSSQKVTITLQTIRSCMLADSLSLTARRM